MSLDEFTRAYRKYNHFFSHLKADASLVRRVEEAQQAVMARVKSLLDTSRSLEENLEKPEIKRELEEALREIAGILGEEPPSLEEALRAVGDGRVEGPGRVGLLALQAVARAYADLLLEREGPGYEPSQYCPVCGAPSQTMVKEGRSFYMICHFCTYKWLVSQRGLLCPYCGNTNPVSIGLFSDRKRRVALALCQECGTLWNIVVDESIKAPRILLPLIASSAQAYRVFIPDGLKEIISD